MLGGDGSAAVDSLLCVCHHRLLAGTVVYSPRKVVMGWYRLGTTGSQSSRRRSSASQARVPFVAAYAAAGQVPGYLGEWGRGCENDEMRPKRDGRQLSFASPSFCVVALLCSAFAAVAVSPASARSAIVR